MAETELDDLATAMAIGVTASVAQFVIHEVVGHGSVCLLIGGRIVAIAPLWMRCSLSDWPMVLAGPTSNVVAGTLCWGILRRFPPRNSGFRLFLWLSIAFQWLVAAGYLAVGAASGFGDWPVLVPTLLTSWPLRLVTLGFATAGYLLALRSLARLGVQRLGTSLGEKARLTRVALAPGLAAAAVSLLAEFVGGRIQPLGLALAVGCTAFVGWSLLGLTRFIVPEGTGPSDDFTIRRSRAWVLGGAVAALALVGLLGPAFGS